MPDSSSSVAPPFAVRRRKRIGSLSVVTVVLAMPAIAVFFEFLPTAFAPLRYVAAMLLAFAVVAFVVVINRVRENQSIQPDMRPVGRTCVLFVAEKQANLSLLHAAFQREFHVLTAQSASEALRICAVQTVHVVVSYQRLDSVSGLELLSKIHRRHPAATRILLIAFTDLATVVATARAADLFACIDLPWRREALLEKITAGAAHAMRQTTAQT